jgi:integrase
MMFAFCVKAGWCSENPCAGLQKIRAEEETPETYTNEEIQLLLDTVAGDPELRPILVAFAIALFGFLRIAEVKRLTREEIKLRPIHPIVTVQPSKAKTRSLRNVAISPNLRVILENCDLPLGPTAKIAPPDFDWRREQLHKRSGVPWRRNGLRHTGASNHCVRPFQFEYPTEDHGTTSAMLGHRNHCRIRPSTPR